MPAFIQRDGHNIPLPTSALHMEPVMKSVTFDGATTDDPGDFDGAGNPHTLFTVTGLVRVAILAVVTTDLVGGTLSLGTAVDNTAYIPARIGSNFDAGEIWHRTTTPSQVEPISTLDENFTTADIVQTVGTADMTAGALTYYAYWQPMSPDGNLIPTA